MRENPAEEFMKTFLKVVLSASILLIIVRLVQVIFTAFKETESNNYLVKDID